VSGLVRGTAAPDRTTDSIKNTDKTEGGEFIAAFGFSFPKDRA